MWHTLNESFSAVGNVPAHGLLLQRIFGGGIKWLACVDAGKVQWNQTKESRLFQLGSSISVPVSVSSIFVCVILARVAMGAGCFV
eukprot:2821550-Amphidinium_carterae.1